MSFFHQMRFFGRVTPIRSWCWIGMAATLPFAVWLEIELPGSSSASLISLLFLQMLAVSTGFLSHARRGFYDPLLVRTSRRSAGLAHWAAATLPGAAIFLAIGSVEAIRAHSLNVFAFGASGWVALLLVSSIPWAISARFGALSGGAVWMLASVSLLVTGSGVALLGAIRAPGQAPIAKAVLAGLVFPMALPGVPVLASVLTALAALSLASVAVAVEWLARAEFPLREEEGS